MLVRYLIRQARGTNQASPNPHTSRREARKERRKERRNERRNPQFQQQPGYGNTYTNAASDLTPQYDASGNQHIPPGQNQYQDSYPPTTYPPVSAQEPKTSTWEVWGPRLRLLAAVFLPVILETLDYTSMVYFLIWSSFSDDLLQSSQQLRPTLPPSSTVSTYSHTSVPPMSLDLPSFFLSGRP
jgi:hypothetical protein